MTSRVRRLAVPPFVRQRAQALRQRLEHALAVRWPRLWGAAQSVAVDRGWARVVRPLDESLVGQKVCLFAHFDADGLIDDHVLFHLGELRRAGLRTILVTTSARTPATEFAKLTELCVAVIERQNLGLDFGSWRTALHIYPELWSAQLLVLANDSVYGPLYELAPLLARMAAAPCDFWGITESRQVKPHYQSYFLAFKKAALAHPALHAWLGRVELLRDKQQIIDRYELELTTYLTSHGLRGGAVVPASAEPTTSLAPTAPRNPMHHGWQTTLARGGPYLKIELLRDNPFHLDVADWPAHLTASSPAPAALPALIERHLARRKARP